MKKLNDKQKNQFVIVSGEINIHDQIKASFDSEQFNFISFYECHSFLRQSFLTGEKWGAVFVDLFFGHIKSLEFIKKAKTSFPDLPIIVLIPPDTSIDIQETLQKENLDFITKPIEANQLRFTLDQALALVDQKMLAGAGKPLTKSISINSYLIGKSPKFIAAIDIAKRVASSNANIVLFGESGTGKEVFANYIHRQSKRAKGPFVAVNCSSIPENLLESEFFGHAKGSFTGALEKRVGLFETAENGTIFLDEIGDLSLALQAKLLRVIQERKIKRVGENIDIPINCRIISATHKDLSKEVLEGRFREDLFFRLNVIPVSLPPLRERPEDVMLLANSFLRKFVTNNDSKVLSFSTEAIEYIKSNNWRGNVRELENTIERAVVLCKGSEITIEDFLPKEICTLTRQKTSYTRVSDENTFIVPCLENLPSLDNIINQYIAYAIKINGGAKDKTAKQIGIDRKTLYKRLQNAMNAQQHH